MGCSVISVLLKTQDSTVGKAIALTNDAAIVTSA